MRSRSFSSTPVRVHDDGVQKLKFLIVEDSAQMRRLIRSFIEGLASEVHECSCGEEAVAAYFATRPDWVLMDIHMEHGDGLTATREIRSRDPGARIVIVTQFDEEEVRRAAAEAGAVAFVLKENLLALRRLLT